MTRDIVIVGSGPAGISTALHLVKYSPDLVDKILVLESQKHPRPKPCAGGILNDGRYILEDLGIDCSSIPAVRVKKACFLFEGRGPCIERLPESFAVVRREEFDAWLVKEARRRGIRIREETRVLEIQPTGQGVKIITDKGEFFSRIVVGADGANSIVRRSITANKNSGRSFALEFIVDPDDFPDLPAKDFDTAIFDFSIITEQALGYIWQFPVQKEGVLSFTRGIYHARLFPERLPRNLKEILANQLFHERLDIENYELQGYPIRFFDPQNTFSAPGVILVGDAAGVDPLLGEGISFALGYGKLAAREIKTALEREDYSFSGYKERILRHPMGICLKRRLRIAQLLYKYRSRTIQRLLWWYLATKTKNYFEKRLLDWAVNEV